MKIKDKYKNGNYDVILMDDGTKIRYGNVDEFIPEFPENIDIKLTNSCPFNCPYCHENSVPCSNREEQEDLARYIWNSWWITSLKKGTEVALGGGALSALDIDIFETIIRGFYIRGVNVNITINQREMNNQEFMDKVKYFLDCNMIQGIGVSFQYKAEDLEKFAIKYRKRVVIHVIAGIVKQEDLEYLASKRFKVLILGYKNLRRGAIFLNNNSEIIKINLEYIKNNIKELANKFLTTSFDCLAIEQLEVNKLVSKEEFERLYLGDDGHFTMYIDIPNRKYAISSTYPVEKRFNLPKNESIIEIFKTVRERAEKEKNDRITN